MAVNENLYSWLLKTQGMPAAEWYRNNPTKPHTSNPHVPPGAAKWFPQASTGGSDNTYASVSPEIIEASVIEPASTGDYFQQFLNSLDSGQRADIEGMGDLTEEDKREIGYNYAAQQKLGDLTPAQKTSINDLITYDPDYGQYGGYITKEDLGFSPRSALYKKYEDAIKNIELPYQDDPLQIGHRALYGTSAGSGSDEGYRMVLANEAGRQARQKAFEDIYQTPLSQLKYQSYSDAPSLEEYRSSISALGLEIPLLQGEGGYFVRAATADDPEVQQFGIYNVGRSDYRQARINEGTQKNIELLKQQAEQGIPSSAEYLRDYLAEKQQLGSDAPLMPLGGDAPGAKGPRGEDFGDLASLYPPGMTQKELYDALNYGKGIDPINRERDMRDIQKEWLRRQQGGRSPLAEEGPQAPVDVRVARAAEKSDVQRERLAQQSEFDLSKEKQLASAKAADAYRRSAASEDPFRAAARVG